MGQSPLYTIGHGNRNIEEFLKLLRQRNIAYLIDVRSKPYSKFYPHFNQNDLKSVLRKNGIRYVFMGESIGGRPQDPSCYDLDGKVDYELVKTKDFFIKGIERLKIAYDKGINVVMMCSESKPCECHRSKLIGRVLLLEDIPLIHIDEKGRLKDQITVINEVNKGVSDSNLFGEPQNSTSRKVYI